MLNLVAQEELWYYHNCIGRAWEPTCLHYELGDLAPNLLGLKTNIRKFERMRKVTMYRWECDLYLTGKLSENNKVYALDAWHCNHSEDID